MTLSFSSYGPFIDYDAEFTSSLSSSSWPDQSGNGFDAYQNTVGKQLTWVSGVFNGHPAYLGVNASNTCWFIPSFSLGGGNIVEGFVVFRNNSDPGTGNAGGAWHMGSSTTPFGTHTAWTDGYFYDDFFSTARKGAFAGVNQTLRRAINDTAHVYDVFSSGTVWAAWLDSQQLYWTNTSVFSPTALSATLFAGSYLNDGTYAISGHIARFMLFSRSLSIAERSAINMSLMIYYGTVRADISGTLDGTYHPVGTPIDYSSGSINTLTSSARLIDQYLTQSMVSTMTSASAISNTGLPDIYPHDSSSIHSSFRAPYGSCTFTGSQNNDGSSVFEPISTITSLFVSSSNQLFDVVGTIAFVTSSNHYLMAGKGNSGTMRYWMVMNNPDFSAQYWSLGDTPLTGVYVSAKW